MIRPRACLMLAGLAAALLAACGERARPVERDPAVAAPASTAKPAATSAVTPADTIPAAFRGEWTMRLEDCGGAGNDSRLLVGPRTLEFHESQGDVVSAAVQGETLSVRAKMSGEGETWEETYRFRLSPDGKALLQPAPPDDEGLRRLRCPEAAPG